MIAKVEHQMVSRLETILLYYDYISIVLLQAKTLIGVAKTLRFYSIENGDWCATNHVISSAIILLTNDKMMISC